MIFTAAATAGLPVGLLLGALAAVFVAAGVGFAVGLLYARAAARRELDSASGQLGALLNLTMRRLDEAGAAVAVLEKMRLAHEQLQRLRAKQADLTAAVERMALAEAESPPIEPATATAFQVDWLRAPEDEATGLPDRFALEQNLQALLAAATDHASEGGLLLVKVDRLEPLARRLGKREVDGLLQKVGGVMIRAAREQDLACRHGRDTFAVLIPGVGAAAGLAVAEAVRTAIKHFHFRAGAGAGEGGPEVLVTASLGLARCRPRETAESVLNRAVNALARSERRGRNQLHIHDGTEVTHCVPA
jgi:diguanylate cyclase (GGDEF)-like protein